MTTKTSCQALLIVGALLLGACGVDEVAPEDGEFSEDSFALDSRRTPTDKGALELSFPETARLSRSEGFPQYALDGKAHWKVRFVLKSKAFKTYLRVAGPGGKTRTKTGVAQPGGGWASIIDWELPATGKYRVLATSSANYARATGGTTGEYTLTSDADVFCGGIAGFQCPSYLKCIIEGDYPDAGGHCAKPDECATPADCQGLPQMLRCVGAWRCDGATGETFGTCAYRCGLPACSELDVRTCSADTRCEVAAEGCENACPSRDECHPCDPIAVCRDRTTAAEGEGCGSRGQRQCGEGLFCAFPAAAQCGSFDAGGTCARRPGACIQTFDPVCGCDGQTYGNACTAASAGVSVASTGACPGTVGASCGGNRRGGPFTCAEGLFCSYSSSAICGFADAAGTCAEKPAACTREYRPVCGCNGTTYGNACMANAAGTSVQYTGACR